MIDFYNQVYELTKKLVQQPSIVGTVDERNMSQLLYSILSELPYFQEHPAYLKKVKTSRDDRERYNVFALVKGSDASVSDTAILLGHMDTVGVEDYGNLRRFAFSPDRLHEKWIKDIAPASIKQEISSGEWLGGRGVLDMKSGVASHIALLAHFSNHREQLKGNLLLAITCDEENNHRGILSALKEFKRIAAKEHLHYLAAINSDYTSPRSRNDHDRYIYLGTVGKLLPTFFVAGKETHAGQLFEGFDPNLVLSELTTRLAYNTRFCDEMYGEFTFPPTSLKQTDLKQTYDVQTPQTAFSYYNFFVHHLSPRDVLEQMKAVGKEAFQAAINIYLERYKQFSHLSKLPYEPLDLQPRVYTYTEFYQQCTQKFGDSFEEHMLRYSINLLQEDGLDIREYSLRMVEELWRYSEDREPLMIVFYSTPYIPRAVLDEEHEKGRKLILAVKKAVEAIQPHCTQNIKIHKFYPYISDMSFVNICDNDSDIQAFVQNMPAWGKKYSYNVDEIRELDVPVINVGTYGKDAHKQWERVELSYSMQMVPNLTYEVIQQLFDQNE